MVSVAPGGAQRKHDGSLKGPVHRQLVRNVLHVVPPPEHPMLEGRQRRLIARRVQVAPHLL